MTDAAVAEALNGLDVSGSADKENGSASQIVNGSQKAGVENAHQREEDEEETESAGETSAQGLRQELARARKERDEFEAQYRGLLGKLTQMRSTLGERLRQDAEELEARETQIENLTAETEQLSSTVDTLKEELVASNAEAEKLTSELESLRAQSTRDSTDDRSSRDQIAGLEARVGELLDQSEKLRIDVESLTSSLESERAAREEAEDRLHAAETARDDAEARVNDLREEADRESQTARELQHVLEDLQASQESELTRAIGDYQEKYDKAAEALEEAKQRAKKAETQLDEYKSAVEKSQSLQQEVKEKNLLIGKLRHEAVILNEHLTEALRRLRNEGSDATVDRRLVTNLFLQFLTTPRADAKRFEMLSLIASVLHWSDDERETAGLQKRDGSGAGGGQRTPTSGRKVGIGVESAGKGHGRSKALDGAAAASAVGGEESFSNLFVEFLLSEADKAQQQQQKAAAAGSESATDSPSSKSAASPGQTPGSPLSPGSTQRTSFSLDALANFRRTSEGKQPARSP